MQEHGAGSRSQSPMTGTRGLKKEAGRWDPRKLGKCSGECGQKSRALQRRYEQGIEVSAGLELSENCPYFFFFCSSK